ncbi:MAG: hypothetical protein BWY80_01052 [Firmicutes bacterium ADurb.Bin456]|jgi:hypothetical protein|nr:MAG: hypothetical protein BWY80_01052 [Firmicutes bacterium ADurb.Bin456]
MKQKKLTKTNKSERKPKPKAISQALGPELIEAPGGGLTPRQLKAIGALLEAPTIAAAAQAAGVARVTLYEWLKLEPFREALEMARASLYRAGVDTLKGAAEKAAGRLIELLDSKNENTRRLTAHEILTLAIRIDESQTFEKRLTAIEQALEAAKPAGRGLNG